MSTLYVVCDEHGTALTVGVPECAAQQTAQRIADRLEALEYDEHAVRVRSTSSRDHGRCVHEAQSYDSADTSRCIRNTGHAGACVFDWRSARTA